MSSDGWDSPRSFDTSDSWGSSDGWHEGAGAASATSDGGGWNDDLDGFSFRAPRPTSMAPLWLAMGCASMGVLLGAYALITTGFASEVISNRTILLVILGWLLSGLLCVVALAVYQRQDLKRATSAFYSPNPAAASLRIAVLVAGTLGVLINSYVFATWLARH